MRGWMDVRPTRREDGEDTQVYGMQPGEIDAIRSLLSQAPPPDAGSAAPAPSDWNGPASKETPHG